MSVAIILELARIDVLLIRQYCQYCQYRSGMERIFAY